MAYLGVEDSRMKIMDSDVISRLVELLGDSDLSVRGMVVVALAVFGKYLCPRDT